MTIHNLIVFIAVITFSLTTATKVAVQPFNNLGAYTGPFTQLTKNFLDGIADPDDGFGMEDKMVTCNNDVVFIDLDPDISNVWRYKYSTSTNSWSKDALFANQCPDSGQGGLLPRDTAYVVSTSSGPFGDRLLIIGGKTDPSDPTQSENNVYYSDDCGINWNCYDGQQTWDPRDFATVIQPNGVLPANPVIMAGGINQGIIFSVAFFLSYDFGITWQRPECTRIDTCSFSLDIPDTFGRCIETDDYYKHCYVAPDTPTLSGSLFYDWNTLYVFYEPDDRPEALGAVFYLNYSNFATGWSQLPNAPFGPVPAHDGGRKIYIRGTVPNTGCWFSTDYLTEELWVFNDDYVVSTNSFQVADSIYGPWRNFTAPWTPRASSALTTSWKGNAAYFAGGMTFVNGDASLPGFGDAWQIDVGVCLLAPSGTVCNSHGTPNLDSVTCNCDNGWSGKYCMDGSSASNSAQSASTNSATTAAGVSIGLLLSIGAGLYVYSTYFGGGPVLQSLYDSVTYFVGGSSLRSRFLAGSATSATYSSSTSPLKSGYGSV
jgi:hypothetical protein